MNEILHSSTQLNTSLPAEFAFSNILKIDNARQAFEIFVNEMTAVVNHISQLRQQLANAAYTTRAEQYEKLFLESVQQTSDHFFAIREYAMECAIAKSIQTAVHLPYATQDQAFVRSLSDAMMILRGYTSPSITITHEWDARDWCIDRLVALTKAYQDDLQASSKTSLHDFIENNKDAD